MTKEEQEKALSIYEDWHIAKEFEVGDKKFTLNNLNHEFRVKVYALYSQIETPMVIGNYGFLEDAKFKALFKEVQDKVLFEDMQISKIPNFWEDNAEIYLSFIQISLKLICYPFFRLKKKDTN